MLESCPSHINYDSPSTTALSAVEGITLNRMKRINVFLLFVFSCMGIFSQANYDAFVGTWVYQSNDTIFRIKLQKGIKRTSYATYSVIFGGYYLSVKNEVREDYIKEMPTIWIFSTSMTRPLCNIYIDASSDTPNYLGFTFYDQRKQHLNGEGMPGGMMNLISSDKLHWKLDEEEGLWIRLEGSGEDVPPCGFSVPTDVIMTKEK